MRWYEMTEKEKKEIADNISDSLFFAPDDIRDRLIELIDKRDKEIAEMIRASVIFS